MMRSLLVEARKLNGQLLLAYLTSLALHFSTKTQQSKSKACRKRQRKSGLWNKNKKKFFFKPSTKSKQLFFHDICAR